MARSEARISVAIWKDPDYRALSFGAQWLYECLVSQSDLSYAGVVPLRVPRWSRFATGLTVPLLEGFLAELTQRQYVIVDDDSGEVLVRSFMRHDEVWRQPNVLRAALRALGEIESAAILSALVPEVERMATGEGVTERVAELLAEMLETLRERLKDGEPEPQSNPSGNPSPNPSGNPLSQDLKSEGGGGMVTAVTTDSPHPPPPSPLLPPPAGASKPRRRSSEPQPGQPITAAHVVGAFVDGAKAAGLPTPAESLRARVGKQAAKLLAEKGQDPTLVLKAADDMGRAGWSDLAVQIQRTAAERSGSNSTGQHKPYTNNPDPDAHSKSWERKRVEHR